MFKNFKNSYKTNRSSDENTFYMKVAQNDETNPNMQPVDPPHTPSISNTQLSSFSSFVRKRETPGILSRLFSPFVGITYPCVSSPLAPRICLVIFCVAIVCSVIYLFPLRCFFSVDSDTAINPETFDASVFDYGYASEGSFRLQSFQASPPPLDQQISPIPSLYCLH